jgi:arsenite methyltransferase
MDDEARDPADMRGTSTGSAQSEAGWLDVHFEACRTEYVAMLRSVGLRPGWRVLDAGSGSGAFLPLIAAEVGAAGLVTALDLAPENVAAIAGRIPAWDLPCPVETRIGSVTDLPFPDAAFDALWCANTTEYLTDTELARTLAEFRRVVRPGGVVAIKDQEVAHMIFAPMPPEIWWHLLEVGQRHSAQAAGVLRGRSLRRWLEGAGLEDVWQRTTLIERWAPLRPVEHAFLSGFLETFAQMAEAFKVPEGDLAFWRAQRDGSGSEQLVNHPDLYYCEGSVVAVGRVPPSDPS